VHPLDDGRQPKSCRPTSHTHPATPRRLHRLVSVYFCTRPYVGVSWGSPLATLIGQPESCRSRHARTGHLRNGTPWDPDGGAGLTSTAAPPSSHARPTRERLNCSWNCRSCPDGGLGCQQTDALFSSVRCTWSRFDMAAEQACRCEEARNRSCWTRPLADAAHAVEPPGIRHLQQHGSRAVNVPEMNRQPKAAMSSMVGYR
jgi:hypothetical protein